MNPFDRVKSPQPPPPGEDDLIDLTEVMEDGEPLELTDEAAAEVVLDFRNGTDGLAALKAPPAPPEEEPPAPPAAHPEESLDDFLASLPELPEELDIPDNTQFLKGAAAPDLSRELAGRLDEAELQDLVRRVVQETVERLARELVPPLALEAIERELARMKKRLTEPD
jgi:hypothetical protein